MPVKKSSQSMGTAVDLWTYSRRFIKAGPLHLAAAGSTALVVVGVVNMKYVPQIVWWALGLVGFFACGFLVWQATERELRTLNSEPVSEEHRDLLRSIAARLRWTMGVRPRIPRWDANGLTDDQGREAINSHFPKLAETVESYQAKMKYRLYGVDPAEQLLSDEEAERIRDDVRRLLEAVQVKEKIYGSCAICSLRS